MADTNNKKIEYVCNQCGKDCPIIESKSNASWTVYDYSKPCECGGKFVINDDKINKPKVEKKPKVESKPKIVEKPIIEAKQKAEQKPKTKTKTKTETQPKTESRQKNKQIVSKETIAKEIKVVKKKKPIKTKEIDTVVVTNRIKRLAEVGARLEMSLREQEAEKKRLEEKQAKELKRELRSQEKVDGVIQNLLFLHKKCIKCENPIRSLESILSYGMFARFYEQLCDYISVIDVQHKIQTPEQQEYTAYCKDKQKELEPFAIEYSKIVKAFWLDLRENGHHTKYLFFREQFKEKFNNEETVNLCRDLYRIENGNLEVLINRLSLTCFDTLARNFDVDSYLIALEWNRKEENSFYLPRRKCFMNMETIDGEKFSMIQDSQDYIDGKLDFLFTSMPQRCGKTGYGLLIQSLLIQKDIDKSIFGIGHSAGLADHFYTQICNIMQDKSSYRYFEIFKNQKLYKTSSEKKLIELNKSHAFANFTFRSIDGDITGSTEASLGAYVDDVIKDVSEVINPDLADKIFGKILTLALGRMKDNIGLNCCGTLWGDNCPFTRLITAIREMCCEGLYDSNRVRIRQLAWCNSQGESQFNYKYNGYSTKFFMRLKFTMAEADYPLWCAMYLSQPISRDGRPLQALKFYDELPKNDIGETIKHDYVGMAIDIALGSGDYYSAPIGYVYESKKEVYFEEWIHTKKDTDYTLPYTVEKIIEHNVMSVAVEEKEPAPKYAKINFGIGEKLSKLLLSRNYVCNIESKSAAGESNKRNRILGSKSAILAMEIENTDYKFYYLSSERRKGNVQYEAAIREILNWSEENSAQKRQQDGAPDSLSLFRTRILKMQPKGQAKTFSMKLLTKKLR